MAWSHVDGVRLFEVPVYRVSPDKWQEEQDEGAEELLWEWEEAAINTPDLDVRARWLYRNELGPYEFNQVVAYLQLVWDGPGAVVKGYLSAVDQRQFTRNFRRTKPFRWVGKVLELQFFPTQESSEIATIVVSAVEGLTDTEPNLKRRFIDSAPLRAVANAVDWRHVLGLATP
jgi:hypothetical protein